MLAGFALGCGETVDTSNLPDEADISDYKTNNERWTRITDVTGDIPGHFDTYRIIYVNDIARTYEGVGDYPLYSVIVKEVRDKNGGEFGELEYIAVMRQVMEGDVSVALDEGWLFTYLDDIGGEETYVSSCWQNCHIQAPFRGTWFDYGVD